jgi:hypothetical protein
MKAGLMSLALLSLGLVGYGAGFLRRAVRARRYVQTPAMLMSIGVVEKLDSAGSYHKRWHAVEARYQYVAGGRTFQSSRVGLDRRSAWAADPDEAERLVSALCQHTVCFVDPAAPGRAVLMASLPQRRKRHYQASLLAGLLLAAVSAALWALGR